MKIVFHCLLVMGLTAAFSPKAAAQLPSERPLHSVHPKAKLAPVQAAPAAALPSEKPLPAVAVKAAKKKRARRVSGEPLPSESKKRWDAATVRARRKH